MNIRGHSWLGEFPEAEIANRNNLTLNGKQRCSASSINIVVDRCYPGGKWWLSRGTKVTRTIHNTKKESKYCNGRGLEKQARSYEIHLYTPLEHIMTSSAAIDDSVKEIARRWLEMEKITSISTSDCLLERPCHLKHVAWKFNDSCNEIWIDGVLGVVFTPNQLSETGEVQTKVHYDVDVDNSESKTAFHAIDLTDLARWHLAWLTDPNVWIDSATIDMEFDQKLLVEKRKFKIKELNISVQSNYPTVHGWLLHMHHDVESLIFRGNGILDANKFLQLPFASRLRKLMIVYESSFDDRLLVQLTAEHLQLASDFITDVGINRLLHRWNDMNYPIRSTFIIYVQIKNSDSVVKSLDVLEVVHNDNGVSEYLIEMRNPNARMRVITRPSSVICTIFAVDNSQAPPPLAVPEIEEL